MNVVSRGTLRMLRGDLRGDLHGGGKVKTTLNKIREHEPCAYGWQKLLTSLGKTKADDEPLEITTIIDSNGIDDALWCLRAVEGNDKEIRLFAVWCARQVQNLMTDQRSLDALDVAERFANGQATHDELTAARDAARDVWYGAAWAAREAAALAAADFADDAARYAAMEMGIRQEAELRRICGEVVRDENYA